MKIEEFTSFDEKMPKRNKWIIVTNNIKAINVFGEMSHVWLTIHVFQSCYKENGLVCSVNEDCHAVKLTHWKYV